jgi:hypothetical protein
MLATIDEEQQWVEFLRWCNDKRNQGVDVPERFHLHSEAQTVRLRVPKIVRKRRFARVREELAVLRARAELSLLGLKVWLRS